MTPTGDELPELTTHWLWLESQLGPLQRVDSGHTLGSLIRGYNSLPSWRMRWCTRRLKIQPAIEFSVRAAPAVMYVGLRYDEETRGGIYGDAVTSRYPMQEWGWGINEVREYLRRRGVTIPGRTDCARCYGQRLGEWRALWRAHPEVYASAVDDETRTGHTFRSAQRDQWPASLAALAVEFALGRHLRGTPKENVCRVCSL